MAELKRKSFNLINKEVELRTSVKVERDWYTLFNLLIICMALILSAISYLVKLDLKSDLDKKSTQLATNVNTNLNSVSKSLLKGRIDVLTDKFSIYQDFLVQNFDTNQFYKEITGLYPNLKIDRFVVKPDSNLIQTNLRLETKGYNELPQIINKLKDSKVYTLTHIKNVSFELNDVSVASAKDTSLINQASKSDTFVTLITVDFEKNLENTENAN